MTTFIKLTNGVTINRETIRSFQKEERTTARMFAEMLVEAERQPQDLDKPKPSKPGIPSIKLVTDGEQTTLLDFATTEERDAEYDRIDAFVQNRPQMVFEDLSLNMSIVQSVHPAWGYQSLKISIKLGPEEPLVISVPEDDKVEMERAKTFLAHFGLEVPKTMSERIKEMYDEKGNRKGGRGF